MYIVFKGGVGASFFDVLDAFDHAKRLGAGATVTTYDGVRLGDIVSRPPLPSDDGRVKLRVPERW
jgi:hypothetical protein